MVDTLIETQNVVLLGIRSTDNNEDTATTTTVQEQTVRYYPGDLVCYRAKKPYEWIPWYGVVLSPNSPYARYCRSKTTPDENPPVKKKSWSKATVKEDQIEPTGGEKIPSEAELQSTAHTEENNIGNQAVEEVNIEWTAETGVPNPIYIEWMHSSRIGAITDRTEIVLVDRNLQLGQPVQNEDGQKGIVIGDSVKVTLQALGTNHVIDGVSVEDLNPVSGFIRGREILYHDWIGVIGSVRRKVTSRLDNSGHTFALNTTETDGFMKNDPYWSRGMPCPGGRITFSQATMKQAQFNSRFMRAVHRWLPPVSYFFTRSEATTISVETLEIDVIWLEKCPTAEDPDDTSPPPPLLSGSDLNNVKTLGIPNYYTLNMNSVRMYGIKEEDSIITYNEWYSGFQARFFGAVPESFSHFNPNKNKLNSLKCQPGYEVPCKIVFRQADVEIAWENGSVEYMLASKVPILLNPTARTEFQPGDIVELIFKDNGIDNYGVVNGPVISDVSGAVDVSLVQIRWIHKDLNTNEYVVDTGLKTESIYDLTRHSSIAMMAKGTIVFIKDHPQGYTCGTVVQANFRQAQIYLAIPDVKHHVAVFPHMIIPCKEKCHWDFFRRQWKLEPSSLLPAIAKEDGVGIPTDLGIPVMLTPPNFTNDSGTQIGSIGHEPAFQVLSESPAFHRFRNWNLVAITPDLSAAIAKEIIFLGSTAIPNGIWIRAYENRRDLFSVMMLGPEGTPYEDGFYFFDLQVSERFPKVPPRVYHIPYTTQQISPFIANEGAICMSKINWTFEQEPPSYILNVIQQIKVMVFTAEPHLEYIGKTIETATPEETIISRNSNEMIFMNILTSYYRQTQTPYEPWRALIQEYFSFYLPIKLASLKSWMALLAKDEIDGVVVSKVPPIVSFNILPVSKGFRQALKGRIEKIESLIPPSSPLGSVIDSIPVNDTTTVASDDGSSSNVESQLILDNLNVQIKPEPEKIATLD